VLLQSVAMSARECRRIAEFERAGGTVIADDMTATMDDHCRRLPRGQLDDLFGIERKSVEWRGSPAGGRADDLPAFEPGVSSAGGKPQRRSENGAPMVIVKPMGRGRAVYLSVDMHEYGKQRLKLEGEAIRDLFASLLSQAGVRPRLRVTDAPHDGKPVPCVRIWRFAADDGTWFGVMRNPEPHVKELRPGGLSGQFGDRGAGKGPDRLEGNESGSDSAVVLSPAVNRALHGWHVVGPGDGRHLLARDPRPGRRDCAPLEGVPLAQPAEPADAECATSVQSLLIAKLVSMRPRRSHQACRWPLIVDLHLIYVQAEQGWGWTAVRQSRSCL
jgi:hypothetical protein